MELLQLRYFLESANNENFAKTAEKYMVPTSSVSASVKRLETELACKLFDRTHNKIILNDKGRTLQKALSRAFYELDSAVEAISGTIRDTREIKMLVCATRSRITDYIIDYKKKNPGVAFKTVFDFGKSGYENYDIIIDEKSDMYPDYEFFELYSMKIRMTANEASPLCRRKLTLKQLRNQPFVSLGENSNMHKMLIRSCKRAGFTPNISALSNDIECHNKLVSSGIGIGLRKESAIKPSEKISFLDVTDFNERYTVCVYFKKNSDYGNVRSFLDYLRSCPNVP